MKFARTAVAAGVIQLLAVCTFTSCMSSPQAKSARFIEAGQKLLKKNDATRAILQFQNAVRTAPGSAEAHYQLATAYMAAGDGIQAGLSLKKALELNPKHQGAQLLIAKSMITMGDQQYTEDAEKRLEALLEESPDDPDALHALALTELKLADPADAMKNLGKALAKAPQSLVIAVTLAQAKLQQGDPKGAEDVLQGMRRTMPNSVPSVVILGKFYLAEKRLADAEQQFRQALSMDPNDTNALFSLGQLQSQNGQKQDAEQTFRKLSRLPDKQMQASLAAFLAQEGRHDEALQELARLSKEDPSDRRIRTWLVNGYLAANRAPEAETVLAAALKKNPKDSDAMLQRGEMALSAGKFDQAETDLNQVLRWQNESAEVRYILAKVYHARNEDLRYREALSKALQLNPYLITVRLELATALVAANGAQAALDILTGTPGLQKTLPAVLAVRNWALWAKGDMAEMRKGIDQGLAALKSPEFMIQDGLWKLQSGDAAGARVALEAALNINPGDIRALSALRQAMAQQKQTVAAMQKVKEYAAKKPKSAPVQQFLGMTLAAQGSTEEARQAFVTAKTADPQSVIADLSLVQLDIASHKTNDAERRLQDVLASHGDNTTARLWLGIIRDAKGNHAEALEDFRKVVQADPANAQALNNLAYLLADFSNQTDEALKYAQKAQQIAPDNLQYTDTMGWILYRKGMYSAAVHQLERLGGQTGPAVWKYHLAMAYAKNGDLKQGKEMLAVALKSNPNIPEARAAKDLLASAK